MGYRTHLTTPPGEDPVLASAEVDELYTPGLALPEEPTVPMRFRGQLIALAVLVGLVVAAFAGFQMITSGQDFDPSLDVQTPEEEFDPTIPIPGEG